MYDLEPYVEALDRHGKNVEEAVQYCLSKIDENTDQMKLKQSMKHLLMYGRPTEYQARVYRSIMANLSG